MVTMARVSRVNIPSSTEAETAVSEVVQSVSSGGMGFVYTLLTVMMIVLMILAGGVIFVIFKQETLRRMLGAIEEKLGSIESLLKPSVKYSETKEAYDYDLKKKGPLASTRTKANNDVLTQTKKEGTCDCEGKTQNMEEKARSVFAAPGSISEESSGKTLKKVEDDREYTCPPPTVEEAYPVSGLRVSESSHYSAEGSVILSEVPREEALLLLYSDMTVRPVDRIFNVYNNASFYSGHDLTMIFKFFNRMGTALSMRNPTKCLSLSKPALVVRGREGYILDEKGFILAVVSNKL